MTAIFKVYENDVIENDIREEIYSKINFKKKFQKKKIFKKNKFSEKNFRDQYETNLKMEKDKKFGYTQKYPTSHLIQSN